jgi:uroporphyrinogen-III synthase
LEKGGFDIVVFMTGVGVRLLTRILESLYSPVRFAELLRQVTIVARGPKPVTALRELGVGVNLTVPEPNTWHELLAELDRRKREYPLEGKRVALQEYGVSNPELVAALQQRGTKVTCVPVYEWTLPEDLRPLQEAVAAIVHGEVSVLLVTSSIQVRHLFQVAKSVGSDESLRKALANMVIASIGPLTSEELRHESLRVDLEPSHPKMGFLVQEAAQRSSQLLQRKRMTQTSGPAS